MEIQKLIFDDAYGPSYFFHNTKFEYLKYGEVTNLSVLCLYKIDTSRKQLASNISKQHTVHRMTYN